MRRLTWIVLGVLLVTMGGGAVLAQQADKCAAEKKAVADAEKALKAATDVYMAAIDKMADAYGEASAATAKASSLSNQLRTAIDANFAAWQAFDACRVKTPTSMCEREYKAWTDARSRRDKLERDFNDALMAMDAANLVLEDAKARFRAANKAMKDAEQALEKARIALGKCQRVAV